MTGWRARGLVGAAFVAALIGLPARAAATPALRFLTSASFDLRSDGERFAAYETRSPRGGFVTHVLDTRRGRAFTFEAGGPSCLLGTVADGMAVWSCRQPTASAPPLSEVVVLDLARRRRIVPPGLDRLPARYPWADRIAFDAAGRRWLKGAASAGPRSEDFYVDWHTGAIRPRPRLRARQIVDLNARGLVVPLCRPLRRRDVRSNRYQYDPPFGLGAVVTPRRLGAPVMSLAVDRCGHGRWARLAIPTLFWGPAQLGAGIVTWTTQLRVEAYVARARRRLGWPLAPFSPPPIAITRAAHTRNRIFLSVPSPPPGGDWRVYVAKLS